jgi:hypothetical protein
MCLYESFVIILPGSFDPVHTSHSKCIFEILSEKDSQDASASLHNFKKNIVHNITNNVAQTLQYENQHVPD